MLTTFVQSYYWSLLTGPKDERSDRVPGKRYYIKHEKQSDGEYKDKFTEVDVPDIRTSALLIARILIAEIVDLPWLVAFLRYLPVGDGKTWVADALAELAKDPKAFGKSELN